jgi:hypothetical protein
MEKTNKQKNTKEKNQKDFLQVIRKNEIKKMGFAKTNDFG